jgi:DNA polymerase-3 subunit epsilon
MFPALPSDALADALLDSLARPIVFVDLETTGGNATTDRVTEIGVVEVSRAGIERWSVLVDPGTPVPPFIEKLTGISDAMLQGQPTFASLAEALIERLAGKLFVAHNARFDYGFLKNEFRRAGLAFRADVLCTVRLSRALFPSVQRHGLDSLIARFGLAPEGRHRALADADLLWQFWQKIHELYSQDLVDAAIKTLIRRAALPAALPESASSMATTTCRSTSARAST